jgi:hypothetical protein
VEGKGSKIWLAVDFCNHIHDLLEFTVRHGKSIGVGRSILSNSLVMGISRGHNVRMGIA